MDKQTKDAILESIFSKWEGILSCKGLEKGGDDCPLCKLFADHYCAKCPIARKTGLQNCVGTPFDEWYDEAPLHRDSGCLWLGRNPREEVINAAVREQEFLISLLPPADQQSLEALHKKWCTK